MGTLSEKNINLHAIFFKYHYKGSWYYTTLHQLQKITDLMPCRLPVTIAAIIIQVSVLSNIHIYIYIAIQGIKKLNVQNLYGYCKNLNIYIYIYILWNEKKGTRRGKLFLFFGGWGLIHHIIL